LKTTDQKKLELLYEQLGSNVSQILPEEQDFFDRIAERYVQEITNAVKRMDVTTSGFFLDQIFFTNPIWYDLDALNIEDLDLKEDVWVTLDETVLHYINSKLVFLHKTKRGPFIFFKDINTLDNSVEHKEPVQILISKENQQIILSHFKQLMSELILYFYNKVLQMHSHTKQENKNWAKWRKHELELKKLKQKLPELEGVL
jgi:hypothetical protein